MIGATVIVRGRFNMLSAELEIDAAVHAGSQR